MKQEIRVIRLSERGYRDLRITTHCCLVTRAFGGKEIFLSEDTDHGIQKTIERISHEFGGDFKVTFIPNTIREINKQRKEGNVVVHLTMYGEKPDNTTQVITVHAHCWVCNEVTSKKVESIDH